MKTLIIHANSMAERREHMEQVVAQYGLDHVFILDGDIDTLDQQRLNRYFADGPDNMKRACAATSCAMKHLLAYQYIVDQQLSGALVLEDDILLHKNFKEVLLKSLEEYQRGYADQRVMISYEDSTLTFVPRSQRQKGRVLYKADKDRYAGAYYINQAAAKAILDEVEAHKCHLPIDGYHNFLLHQGVLEYLWCQPAVATQGSFTGRFLSSMPRRSNSFRWLRWQLKLAYRKLLFWLR